MVNSKVYDFLMSVKCLLTQSDKQTSVVSNSNIPESQKCILECASYNLIKTIKVNKHALENSDYNLVKRRK